MFSNPQISGFKVLRILAILCNFGGIILIMGIAFAFVFLLVDGTSVALEYFPKIYVLGLPLLLVGQLILLALSMWELSVEKRNLLLQLLSEPEHNKSLNTDTGDAGAG